jgi:arylsulfatase A-like enzyme
MPNVKVLLADQGIVFSSFFASISLCCPSRATILRGQYGHNTTILANEPPDGGFQKFYELQLENSTIATWLQSAGYRTALIGKYLNGYPEGVEPTYIPPGWNEWYSPSGGHPYTNFNYELNENGKIIAYGEQPEDYFTDVASRKAVDFIERASADHKPFFLYLSIYAPHSPNVPAPRHADLFAGARVPLSPSFNEADVSDKPEWVRTLPLLKAHGIKRIDKEYRKRLQSLQAVDEMVGSLVKTLERTKEIDDTFIFFTSDNGYHMGEHRLPAGKKSAYEEDIHAPLIVRGPGVPEGQTRDHLAGNIDLAPTFAALAGTQVPEFVDGRPLAPLLNNNPLPVDAWRQAFLVEHIPEHKIMEGTCKKILYRPPPMPAIMEGTLEPPDVLEEEFCRLAHPGIPEFGGLRTPNYKYIEYITGESELYDLQSDPYELQNIASTADPALLEKLHAQLTELLPCRGENCRIVEDQPIQ